MPLSPTHDNTHVVVFPSTLMASALLTAYDVSSYEDLADASLGHVGRYALALFTAITNLLANSAHMATAVKLLHSDMELCK